MNLRARTLSSGIAFAFLAGVLVSCGAGTGETAASSAPKAAASQPAATQAVAQAAPAQRFLILQGDTIRGQESLNEEEKLLTYPGIHCTQQSRFPQGQRIVWRFKVFDGSTGKALDDKALKSVVLTLPDGKNTNFAYGGHGGTKENPADYLWANGFSVPIDYPTGSFPYKITATAIDGTVGVYEQFKVPFAQLQIVPAAKK